MVVPCRTLLPNAVAGILSDANAHCQYCKNGSIVKNIISVINAQTIDVHTDDCRYIAVIFDIHVHGRSLTRARAQRLQRRRIRVCWHASLPALVIVTAVVAAVMMWAH
jgi:hypothetical protein